MADINTLLEKLTVEMWAVKEHVHTVGLTELLDFYRSYEAHANLAVDLLNDYVVGATAPLSDEESEAIVSMLTEVNGYRYNRLIIDTLLELDCSVSRDYLSKILNFSEEHPKQRFEEDFGHHPAFHSVWTQIDHSDNRQE